MNYYHKNKILTNKSSEVLISNQITSTNNIDSSIHNPYNNQILTKSDNSNSPTLNI
ncbi:6436_t:CDS:1, partial [Ambispora leptoticha]